MNSVGWSDESVGSIKRVDYVLDCLQFLRNSTRNDLSDDQIPTVYNDLSSHQNRISNGPNSRWLDLDGSIHLSYNSANSSAF